MRLTNKKLIIIFAGLLLLSAAWILTLRLGPEKGGTAQIYVDGVLRYEIDLSRVEKEYEIELEHNTVLITRGGVRMLSADCPDGLCIRQGLISSGAYPIVCLPNRVEIRIVSGGGFDAATGGGA